MTSFTILTFVTSQILSNASAFTHSTLKPSSSHATLVAAKSSQQKAIIQALPKRTGLKVRTSGRVPHVQTNVTPNLAINKKLFQLAFSLPNVEKHASIASLPGASGIWLKEKVPVRLPRAILAGREFAHLHSDGSLHLPLPYQRALEVAEKGWGERHPWAEQRSGWDGLVMIFTPLTESELDIVFQLIIESYNHVTGLAVKASEL
ncbi:MAG: luciferase family protein [Pseudomonadota bacterium]